jgi:hypothetical protein
VDDDQRDRRGRRQFEALRKHGAEIRLSAATMWPVQLDLPLAWRDIEVSAEIEIIGGDLPPQLARVEHVDASGVRLNLEDAVQAHLCRIAAAHAPSAT